MTDTFRHKGPVPSPAIRARQLKRARPSANCTCQDQAGYMRCRVLALDLDARHAALRHRIVPLKDWLRKMNWKMNFPVRLKQPTRDLTHQEALDTLFKKFTGLPKQPLVAELEKLFRAYGEKLAASEKQWVDFEVWCVKRGYRPPELEQDT
jgi:hypothetical protein